MEGDRRGRIRASGRWALGVIAGALILAFGYVDYLVTSLDISRAGIEARARTVETSIVPKIVVGPGGRFFDAAMELPLALPPERIPDFVENAFITREDQQFRSLWHVGVNPLSIARAAITNAQGWLDGRPSKWVGGSTITMQLAKNLLLHQEQTLRRYLDQLIVAVAIEALFSKDEIIAMYLNTAYFGDGAYGVEAAARKFFGRSVGYAPKINLFEAAMLASSIQAPSRHNPRSDREGVEEDAHALVAAMMAEGYDIEGGEGVRPRGEKRWSIAPNLFRDVAMRFMVPAELSARDERMTIGITLDTEAQLYAELAAHDMLNSAKDAGYDSSVIIVMEHDGAVAAIATGHDYDGVDMVRNGTVSPGSTLKPFLYLCALEQGLRPDDVMNDERREMRPDWVPENFDGKYRGMVTVEHAFIRSLNTIAVQIYDRFGDACFESMLARAGIDLDEPDEPTAVLGSEYVSLLSLAGAYATLANGGQAVTPYAIRYARRRSGEMEYEHPTSLGPFISGERPYCDLMRMMRNVTSSEGTGHEAAVDRPVWGKTGTSSFHRDALFAGFTGRYVAVVWLGRQARGNVSRPITGGELPAKTFGWLMATLEAGKEPVEIDCRRELRVAANTPSSN